MSHFQFLITGFQESIVHFPGNHLDRFTNTIKSSIRPEVSCKLSPPPDVIINMINSVTKNYHQHDDMIKRVTKQDHQYDGY